MLTAHFCNGKKKRNKVYLKKSTFILKYVLHIDEYYSI